MKNAVLFLSATLVVTALSGSMAKAQTLVYGFETGDTPNATDGFNGTQSTTGVTQGSNSLELDTSQGTGYTIGAAGYTSYVPTALTNAQTVNYDVTADATQFGYLQIFPAAEIGNSTTDHFLTSDPGAQANLGGQALSGTTVTMDLAVFADPDASEDGDTGLYTVGQIIANDTPYDGTLTQTLFQLDYQDSGNADGTTVPFYFDNFVTPTTPEPASLAIFGLGGIALLRRRRS